MERDGTEAPEATVSVPPGPKDADTFKKFVKRIVSKETKAVLESLAAEGAVVGKQQIVQTVAKYGLLRIVQKIIVGDNGSHSMSDRSREKIRTFAKNYLLHSFTKHSVSPSSA